MISPTVGRVVWYYPGPAERLAHSHNGNLAAIITNVWSDSCVNLTVFDANGNSYGRTSILLVQDGEPKPDACYCEWMPYQKGQAAKTEALEAQLGLKE